MKNNLIFSAILYLSVLAKTSLAADFIPRDNILLDCGSGSFDPQITDSDGRKWSSDNGSKYLLSSKGSFRATVATQSPSVAKVPYMSARIFFSNITYSFPISHGRIFLRLHFSPNTYSRTNTTSNNAMFSVVTGSYTLLLNFNPFQVTQSLGVDYFTKEYFINVDSEELVVKFVPSDKSFGFINGIEVVSMPNVYGNNEDGVSIVGASSPFIIDNSTALESLYRLNVGGSYISPTKDTGLSRSWSDDTPYIFGTGNGVTNSIDPDVNITFSESLPSYTAPIDVYSTARFMTPDNFVNLKFNLTWLFSVDTGFTYLVRLHFCQLLSNIDKVNQIVFNVYINNITASSEVDVIALTQSNGIPYVMDFVVIVPTGEDPQQDLWLDLHPDTRDKPQYYNAFLNGLEIFKINNTDGSFA